MAEVKVLVEGIHEKVDGKLKVGSSVSLIKSDLNIVVDTGSFLDKNKIIDELKKRFNKASLTQIIQYVYKKSIPFSKTK